MRDPRLLDLLSDRSISLTTGVFDALSARLAEKAGFAAAMLSGYSVAGAALAEPDFGILTQTEMLEIARRVTAAVDMPILVDGDTVLSTPPSSLNMDRHGSAARTGRAELDQTRRDHRSMTPEIAGGDVDVDVEDAYFIGEEAPGGDNPTPDQDIVDDIGKALGVEYADNEELKASDKVTERDKHRWELDPASSEDYKERD